MWFDVMWSEVMWCAVRVTHFHVTVTMTVTCTCDCNCGSGSSSGSSSSRTYGLFRTLQVTVYCENPLSRRCRTVHSTGYTRIGGTEDISYTGYGHGSCAVLLLCVWLALHQCVCVPLSRWSDRHRRTDRRRHIDRHAHQQTDRHGLTNGKKERHAHTPEGSEADRDGLINAEMDVAARAKQSYTVQVLYCFLLHCAVLHYVLYCTILYTMIFCITLDFIVLCCTALHYAVLDHYVWAYRIIPCTALVRYARGKIVSTEFWLL
jgi:hypothetical protein